MSRLTVQYVHEKPGVHTGNILWSESFRMHGGKFPPNHPCADEAGSGLRAFRERGYWASCFPEGDGITMKCERGQAPETVINDIKECFGWSVSHA